MPQTVNCLSMDFFIPAQMYNSRMELPVLPSLASHICSCHLLMTMFCQTGEIKIPWYWDYVEPERIEENRIPSSNP